MATFKNWLSAFRLRTLPLALASILMGSFLAIAHQNFQLWVFILCVLTTIFLQILSNLANDYGDSIHGADSADRKGPQRAVQSGAISSKSMRNALIIFVFLSLISGLGLLWVAFKDSDLGLFLKFLGLGILAIIAAITYTAGAKPYGYAGFGDISVLIFFGWVGVLGTYFLHTQTFSYDLVLPASACGLFSVAVLNINNIRDIESDKKAGKFSIPVRIGRKNAVLYHWTLLILGVLCGVGFVWLNFSGIGQFLFLITLPLFLKNAKAVHQFTEPQTLDPYLKQMALTTLAFVLTFGIGQLLS